MKRNLLVFCVIVFSFIVQLVNAQEINAYAEVTNISGTTITLSSVDETVDTFEDGDQIIIMQMQDDVIGSNTGDDASFGDLSDIQSAGLYEIVTILSHTESSGLPAIITVSAAFTNTYNTGSNSAVQIISFPTLGSPDYTTSSNILSKDWDGSTGGVVAFNVNGVLTLANDILADESGFRGASANSDNSSGSCDGTTYISATTDDYADKGEGIYKISNSNYFAGKGHVLSGGGGGNSHNGGGGGGSNYSIGGDGGPGWQSSSPGYCVPTAGGLGGLALFGEIDESRIFLGGGGGSGEGNNGGPPTGGSGGGIIILHANEISTTGSCAGISISTNGENVDSGTSSNDGGSGGGAGGSIIIETALWSIDASCDLTISANGGNGTSVGSGSTHGGGGGGGHGVMFFLDAIYTGTTETDPGDGGGNDNGGVTI
ncbi:MAG: T9SS C-terminal target domain-containing protein, partial [Bacteroidales bacterium]|nr:T9SS C-terminal target domain-containing protein [Bacteroidales bacterium]